ncbi:ATP-binding protein [Streptomyces sp. NBC_00483]|uniref:ATP-binding protein n=1 Tax=Streptomyces sp. NBC_00483 TaxID=2975756 RepID=UPI002E196D19
MQTKLPQDIEWRLPRHARSVSRTRLLFREQAGSWALPQEITETAELLLSELMTNAYRHARVPAGREIWARAILTEDRLRVLVTDASVHFRCRERRPWRMSRVGGWRWW